MLVTWIRPLLILLSMFNLSGLGPLLNFYVKNRVMNLNLFLKRLGSNTNDPESKCHLNELKTLHNLRPSVDLDNCLQIEGRLENARLAT